MLSRVVLNRLKLSWHRICADNSTALLRTKELSARPTSSLNSQSITYEGVCSLHSESTSVRFEYSKQHTNNFKWTFDLMLMFRPNCCTWSNVASHFLFHFSSLQSLMYNAVNTLIPQMYYLWSAKVILNIS